MGEYYYSSVKIGKRGPKTPENCYGWYDFESNMDRPCVLVLGGDGITHEELANGMAKRVEEILRLHGCEDVADICSVYYNFGELPLNEARQTLMGKQGRGYIIGLRNNNYISEVQNPRYIDKIYDAFFKTRILSADGTKLPVDEVVKRMRKVTVCAHCHGAYTFAKVEEKLQASLKAIGYTLEEQNKILKSVVCVAYAPYAPLGKSKTTMVSFANASDTVVRHNNYFQRGIQSLNADGKLLFGYYPNEHGNVFVAPDYRTRDPHNWMWGGRNYLNPDAVAKLQINPHSNWIGAKNGDAVYDAVFTMMGNAVSNNVMSATAGMDFPDTKALVSQWCYLENGKVCIHPEATKALETVYETTEAVGKKQLTAISAYARAVRQGQHVHRKEVRRLSDLEKTNPQMQQYLKNQKALREMAEIDGVFFIPQNSEAVDLLQKKGIKLTFDRSKKGYFVPKEQTDIVKKFKTQAQQILNDNFYCCFERRPVAGKSGYVTPDNLPISAQKADEMMRYFRSQELGGKQNSVDLVYDANNKRLSVAPYHVENYERFLDVQVEKLSCLKNINLNADGTFSIPFKSTDELTDAQKTLRMFGVETTVQGNHLHISDMNVIAKNQHLQKKLPLQYATHAKNGYDFSPSKIKVVSEVDTYFEGILPKSVVKRTWAPDELEIKLPFEKHQEFLDELQKRAPNLNFERDGPRTILVNDSIETRAFLAANLDATGENLVPVDVAKKRMREFKPMLEKVRACHTSFVGAKPVASTTSKLAKVGSKVAKGAAALGVVAEVVGAAVDPKGTAEFNDDLLHGRFKKIVGELEEGIDAVTSQPISETVSQISDAVGGAVSEHYAGAETVGDYTGRTLDAAGSGLSNIGDVFMLGVGSGYDALNSGVNAILELAGSDERAVSNSVSIEEYNEDPIGYLKTRAAPATVDVKTGIRSDDSYFTIIDRNDVRVMQNYINHHKGQWIGQKSRINLENHFKTVDENGHPTEATRIEKTVQTPVVYAAFKGKRDMVSLLITDPRMYGYVYEPDQHSGQTALMRLMDRMPNHYFPKEWQQQKQLIKDILSHPDSRPENINKVDKKGNSAFLYAAKAGDTELLVALSKKQANLLQTNNNGENALHLYQGNDPTMISALINAGVDKNQKDSNGRTPLERQICDCVANPSQSAYLRVALFLEFATKEELEALCAKPDMAKRLKQIVDSNPKVAIELQKAHPEFYASSYGRPSQSSAIRTLNDNGESAKPEPTTNTEEQSQTRPTNNKNKGKE